MGHFGHDLVKPTHLQTNMQHLQSMQRKMTRADRLKAQAGWDTTEPYKMVATQDMDPWLDWAEFGSFGFAILWILYCV